MKPSYAALLLLSAATWSGCEKEEPPAPKAQEVILNVRTLDTAQKPVEMVRFYINGKKFGITDQDGTFQGRHAAKDGDTLSFNVEPPPGYSVPADIDQSQWQYTVKYPADGRPLQLDFTANLQRPERDYLFMVRTSAPGTAVTVNGNLVGKTGATGDAMLRVSGTPGLTFNAEAGEVKLAGTFAEEDDVYLLTPEKSGSVTPAEVAAAPAAADEPPVDAPPAAPGTEGIAANVPPVDAPPVPAAPEPEPAAPTPPAAPESLAELRQPEPEPAPEPPPVPVAPPRPVEPPAPVRTPVAVAPLPPPPRAERVERVEPTPKPPREPKAPREPAVAKAVPTPRGNARTAPEPREPDLFEVDDTPPVATARAELAQREPEPAPEPPPPAPSGRSELDDLIGGDDIGKADAPPPVPVPEPEPVAPAIAEARPAARSGKTTLDDGLIEGDDERVDPKASGVKVAVTAGGAPSAATMGREEVSGRLEAIKSNLAATTVLKADDVAFLSSVDRTHPGYFEANRLLADYYFRLKQYQRQAETLEAATTGGRYKHDPIVLLSLAKAYAHNKDYRRSLSTMKRVESKMRNLPAAQKADAFRLHAEMLEFEFLRQFHEDAKRANVSLVDKAIGKWENLQTFSQGADPGASSLASRKIRELNELKSRVEL